MKDFEIGTRVGAEQQESSTALPKPSWAMVLLMTASLGLSRAINEGATSIFPVGRNEFESTEIKESEQRRHLLEEIRRLFHMGSGEVFFDGMDSVFAKGLAVLISRYGRAAFYGIADYMFSGKIPQQVMAEAARLLTEHAQDDEVSHLWFVLEKLLNDSSPQLRDSAILAFSTLNDPHAVKVLRKAQQSEKVASLRGLIDQVVGQLEHAS